MEDQLLLGIMQKNARIKMRDLAAVLDEPKDQVIDKVTELEDKKVICGYHTVINWDRTNADIVTALIEIKATPEREFGYDRIASRIYKFEEVETMYLLAGRYDFALIIRGHTMQQVAQFVASKLAPISGVTETVTTFVLKNYKNSGIVMTKDEDGKDTRLVVTP